LKSPVCIREMADTFVISFDMDIMIIKDTDETIGIYDILNFRGMEGPELLKMF
jgi:hypothetical protein